MVTDALDGKIDLIVTKSVSRFARNTVNSLTTVRKLKGKGMEIYFEKENIWTLDFKGELLRRKNPAPSLRTASGVNGSVLQMERSLFPFGHFLGYDQGPDGNLVLNKAEAAIVKRIFSMFLQGMTPYGIASQLTADGIPSPGHKEKWNAGTVHHMLENEKHKGDALLQKSYTVDFLTKKKKRNNGHQRPRH